VTGNFADNGDFHAILWIFYMPQIFTPKEGVLRIFRPEKSDGFGRV
jgi:hypothetical protein